MPRTLPAGPLRQSVEQYRNPAYGTHPAEPMYLLPSSLVKRKGY